MHELSVFRQSARTKKRLNCVFPLADMAFLARLATCLAPFATGYACFFRSELMRVTALVRRPATFPGNLTLTLGVHGRKATFGFFTRIASEFTVLLAVCHFSISFEYTP
jgi:hypothetical protein